MKKTTKRTAAALCSAAVALSASYAGTIIPALAEMQSAKAAVSQPAFSLSVPELRFTAGKTAEMPEPVAAYTPITSDVELYGGSESLPGKYDMRDTYGITPVRIQTPHGTCWVHSAVASAETSLLKAVPDIDLSELHTAFYTYFGADQLDPDTSDVGDILNTGGNARMVMNLWAQWIGPVLESSLPYDDVHFFDDEIDTINMRDQRDYHLKNAYEFDFNEDRSNFNEINSLVKQFVLSGEAVDISFMSDAGKNYYPEYSSSNSKRIARFADHSVAVVGWDDSFPAEHFRNSPEGDGAWLCKNSWGTHSGEDGYIWISYYDRSLCEFAVFELEDEREHTEIFQHDSFIPIQTMSAYDSAEENGPSYMANVFYASNDTEIDSVGTYIYNPGTEYEITVYTGLTDGNDPTSGTPSGVTCGRCDMTGFLTLDLDSGVYVPEDESFGIVVKLYCPDSPFVIPFESAIYAEDEEGNIFDIGSYSTFAGVDFYTDKAQSFFSADGKSWTDMTDSDFTYSDEDKEYLLASFIEQLYDGLEPEDTELIEEADAAAELYAMLFENSDIQVKMGNVSLKAYGNPAGTVKFSHPEGEVPLNEAVELTAANGKPVTYRMFFMTDNPRDKGNVLYDEPISITEPVTIAAWTDEDVVCFRNYYPKAAGFNFMGYEEASSGYDAEMKYAEKTAPGEYVIRISPECSVVKLYPGTPCNMTMNGSPCAPYRLTEEITADYGVTDVVFSLSGENVQSSEVTVHIERLPVDFDLENETIIYPGNETVYGPDGEVIPSGAYVGDLAGQRLTVKIGDETIEAAVPERHDVSGLELNDQLWTLGAFDYKMGELLEYAETGTPSPEDFISVLSGRLTYDYINSTADLQLWGIAVNPGETITLRAKSGNGKFASEECIYTIPDILDEPFEAGDVNRDGYVDAVDASLVLAHYAAVSTNGTTELDSGQEKLADMNRDGFIDAVDASVILAIYAERSTAH